MDQISPLLYKNNNIKFLERKDSPFSGGKPGKNRQ